MFTPAGQAACSKYCRRQGSASQIGMGPTYQRARTAADSDPTRTAHIVDALATARRRRISGPRTPARGRRNSRPHRSRPTTGVQPDPRASAPKEFERVFVAVLGVDGLAGAEFDHAARHPHLLPLLAGEMHLDAVALGIVEGVMAEACEIEVAVELAIDAREQVEIELRRDAGGVVIGGVEDAGVLHQVDADDQRRAAPEHAPGVAQERRRPRAARNCRWSSPGRSRPAPCRRPPPAARTACVKSASTGSTASCG